LGLPVLEARNGSKIDAVIASLAQDRVDALVITSDSFFDQHS
jgi:uncharacterized protein YrrD